MTVRLCTHACVLAGESQAGNNRASDLKSASTSRHTGKYGSLQKHTWKPVIQSVSESANIFLCIVLFSSMCQARYPPTHSLSLIPSVGTLWKKAAAAETSRVEPYPPDAPLASSPRPLPQPSPDLRGSRSGRLGANTHISRWLNLWGLILCVS